MEQLLGVFGINWKLIIVQIINFGLLLVLLYLFLYKPLFKIIEKRQEKIKEGIESAERAKLELQSAEDKKSSIVTQALKDAEGIVSEARTIATTKEKEILDSAKERSKKIIEEAEKAALAEKEKAIRESEKEVARMAILATEKILKESK